jgi:preprotein translocase subunit YajC
METLMVSLIVFTIVIIVAYVTFIKLLRKNNKLNRKLISLLNSSNYKGILND